MMPDDPNKPEARVRTLGEQIYDALWLCVSPKRNALDNELVELKQNVRTIFRKRDLAGFKELLAEMGKGENTAEGQALIEQFKAIFHVVD